MRDVAAVDDAVAAVFSVTAPAGLSTSEALVEFLRGKQLLLVLDNCEHLLEGAAALAGVLQRSCERLVILATSREGLGIEGERLVPVPPLAVPDTDADLTAITQAEAVRLFAERAAAVKPDFAVTAENAAPVAAAVRRLDGIALAIELAAARIAAMTPAELARRLERSFAVLGAGRRGTLPHHQTLRATIDWSYQLLAEPEQRLLARLAVFAGGCTLEAAETVCGGDGIDPDTVFELLASLVARSLVVTEEHGPETRYRLLETIREYGEERLTETGETDRWQRPTRRLLRGRPLSKSGITTGARRCFGRCGSEPNKTTCSLPGPGRSTPATLTPRFRSWPASRRARSRPGGPCAGRRGGPGAARRGRAPGLPARPGGQRQVRGRSRGCDRHRGTVPRRRRGQRAPASPRLAGRGSHLRRPLNHRGYCRRVRRRRPPHRTGRRYRPDRWRPRRHLPPARPSPRAVTCLSATRPGRSRWPARRSRWPGRSAIRRSSPQACSSSA